MGGMFISHIFFKSFCYLFLAMLLVRCWSKVADKSDTSLYCTLPPSEFIDGNYSAHKAYQAPLIDGSITENSWAFATWASITRKEGGSFPIKYKITWNEDALYVLLKSDSSIEVQDLLIFVDTLSFNLSSNGFLIKRTPNITEARIPIEQPKKDVTLPLRFSLLRNNEKYISRQGYLKLVL